MKLNVFVVVIVIIASMLPTSADYEKRISPRMGK